MTREELITKIKKLGEMSVNDQISAYDVYRWLEDIRDNGIEDPKKYNVQVLLCDEGFLNQIVGDKSFCLDSNYEDCSMKTGFTKSEIEEFKQRDDIAIDWDKAIIEPVEDE